MSSGDTHAADLHRPGRLQVRPGPADLPAAIDRLARSAHLQLVGLHCHIGSQLLDLAPFRRAVEALSALGEFPVYNLGGGLGAGYLTGHEPPAVEDYLGTLLDAAHGLLGPASGC